MHNSFAARRPYPFYRHMRIYIYIHIHIHIHTHIHIHIHIYIYMYTIRYMIKPHFSTLSQGPAIPWLRHPDPLAQAPDSPTLELRVIIRARDQWMMDIVGDMQIYIYICMDSIHGRLISRLLHYVLFWIIHISMNYP